MGEGEILIRKAATPADYVACQDVQRRAWGIEDDSYVVPVATMVGAQHHGGLVLGAFLPGGGAVGLSFAFLGRVGDRWCLYSQLTGVVPEYQGRGIGERLKVAQRDHARVLGLDHIAWAFDPLRAGNARFNLHRLGASSCRYIEDMYGPRSDTLNAGARTDRLIAEWPVSPVPTRSVDPAGAIRWPRLVEGPGEPIVSPLGSFPAVLVEVPTDIAEIRAVDPTRSERWRAAIAGSLTAAFSAGYRAVDLIRDGGRSFYALRRDRD